MILPLPRPVPAFGIAALFFCCLSPASAGPPESTRPVAGIREVGPQVHAVTNVRLVARPGSAVEGATIVVRDGLIEAAGAGVPVPADARVWDAAGRTAYAGFIESYSEVEAPAVPRNNASAHWNAKVTPQAAAVEGYDATTAANLAYRQGGFVARLIAPSGGVIKGTSGVVATGIGNGGRGVLLRDVALHVRLTAPRGRDEDAYPNSPMGAVALARQAMYDARWYRDAWKLYESGAAVPRPERNDAFAALGPAADGAMPVVADALDEQYFLRADAFAKEFGLKLIVRSSGHEYRRVDAVKAAGRAVIAPLDFPKPPDVTTADRALDVSLERLMHWDLAPENPGRLAGAGVTVLLTGHGLKDRKDYWPALRKAVRRGLSEDAALAALTTAPAEAFGLGRLGTIEAGKAASFVLTDGDPFRSDEAKFVETWVDGVRYEIEPPMPADLRGTWSVAIEGVEGPTELVLSGKPEKLKGVLKVGGKKIELTELALRDGRLSARLKGDDLGQKGLVRLTATVTVAGEKPGELVGSLIRPDESAAAFTAAVQPGATDGKPAGPPAEPVVAQKPKTAAKGASFAVNFPLGEYGRSAPPVQPAVVAFVNATVWTCGPGGVVEGGTVLVENGLVKAAGKDIAVPEGATVVDGGGKHITPGLIDCHSHMGTDGGINESTQAVTAEVRIGDFINATDIDIYRQLAGGLTTANVLHGSANPIGGQNQVIKLRWGGLPEELKFAGAPPGIKFALGENVKQSNWGENYRSRYPQTRMGVEQIIRDRFLAAREYRHRHQKYAETKAGVPPRVDLELEALAQVVHGERWVHCHSYRQDEILALLRTLDEFGVTIGTLQHILEGYKVADEMAKHGAGGSSFSDWWAYKFEVYDAIPYAGALMHKNGVVVSFNSDDRELARHLNQEAAKATKYGGVSPEEALKFVTLNPAKQLRIDPYVGSLEPGKHADLVVWNRPPLSNLAVCEQTWIDGRKYFDRAEAKAQEGEVRTMRAALIQKALASGEEAEKPEEAQPMERELWPREDLFCKCRAAK